MDLNRTSRNVRRCTTALLLAAFLPGLALAAKPPKSSVREIRPDESRAAYSTGAKRVDALSGAPVTLYRVGHKVAPADPVAMASEYLAAQAQTLHLKSTGLGDLSHRFTWQSPAGHTVRFAQTYHGVPVYDSEVAVTVRNDATVTFVTSSYKPGIQVPSVKPALKAAEARQLAYDYLGVEGELAHDSSRLVVFAPRERTLLAWEIKMLPRTEPVGDWEVLVDAMTGELVKVVDKAFYVDGNGNIFDPDPLSSANANYGDTGFVDGSDADTPQLDGQLINVLLRDITDNGGTFSLVGPWAEIVDTENPSNGLFAQGSSTFNFTRTQSGFEAVHTYYHIDNIMRYLNVDLGVSITPRQYSGGARFDPHGLNGSDNSHYTSSNGVVAFGEGGVDDAEDADVVIHELGHALHDWVTGGSLSQVEGLSEGSGDYIAASYSRSLGQWGPADPQFNWVFDWDGHNPFWNGRITNYGASYPGGLVGQIHTDGQIWSTCNMKVWDLIGPQQLDRAFWVGLGMTNSNTNQEDAAQAVLQAAVDLGYPASDINAMESTYQGCGYNVVAPCSATCGNGVVECGEVCDGGDLGGETCGTQGCTGGGTLACNASCDGFDTGACLDCPVCNNNGVCELGEDCNGCPNDCAGGTTSGAVCGNGVCEAGGGEDCVSCPGDCNGQQGGKPANRFCCGDGDGSNPLPCSDATCSTGGWVCNDDPVIPGSFCCGDLACDSGESCGNCALDCATGAEVCNDGTDNDCNGATDCADGACSGDPSCPVCSPVGVACVDNADCCSDKCRRGTCR